MADHLATFDEASTANEVVLLVSGELDVASAEEFADMAAPHLATAKQLVVDFERTSFMDSSGLKVLATIALARANAGGVVVRNPSGQVRKLLHVAGMAQVLTIEPPLDQSVRVCS